MATMSKPPRISGRTLMVVGFALMALAFMMMIRTAVALPQHGARAQHHHHARLITREVARRRGRRAQQPVQAAAEPVAEPRIAIADARPHVEPVQFDASWDFAEREIAMYVVDGTMTRTEAPAGWLLLVVVTVSLALSAFTCFAALCVIVSRFERWRRWRYTPARWRRSDRHRACFNRIARRVLSVPRDLT